MLRPLLAKNEVPEKRLEAHHDSLGEPVPELTPAHGGKPRSVTKATIDPGCVPAPVETELEPQFAPLPLVTSSGRHRGLMTGAGGTLFALAVFLFLAWIQPVTQDSDKLELPSVYKFKIQPPPKKATPPPPQDRPVEKVVKPRERPKPKRQRTVARKQTTREVRRPSSNQRMMPASFAGLQGVSLAMPSTGGGTGAIGLPQFDEFAAIAEEAVDIVNYEEQRRAIRDRKAMARRRDIVSDDDVSVATRVRAISVPAPRYPRVAQKKQIEGLVKLRLLISREGRVDDYEIIFAQPKGHFEQAVIDALGRWQFRPASDPSGRPIEAWTTFKYLFKLEDA